MAAVAPAAMVAVPGAAVAALVPYTPGAPEPNWDENEFINRVKQTLITPLLQVSPDTGARVYSNLCEFLSLEYPPPSADKPGVNKQMDFADGLRGLHDRLCHILSPADDAPTQTVPAALPVDPQMGPVVLRLRLWDLGYGAATSPRGS